MAFCNSRVFALGSLPHGGMVVAAADTHEHHSKAATSHKLVLPYGLSIIHLLHRAPSWYRSTGETALAGTCAVALGSAAHLRQGHRAPLAGSQDAMARMTPS